MNNRSSVLSLVTSSTKDFVHTMSSSPGTFRALCVLQLISIVIICLGSPAPSRQNKFKGPSKEAALKQIIAQSRSVQKPKDYEKIVQMARTFDENPQFVEEIDERGPDPVIPVHGRGYTTDRNKLWTYSMLVIVDDEFSEKDKEEVTAAIYTLKKAMRCFDFRIVEQGSLDPDVDHLHIKPRDDDLRSECGSYLGRQGGEQVTVVSSRCKNRYGVTMHEVMHVLGFYHEHVRKDRDDYVEVHWDKLPDERWRAQYEIQNHQHEVNQYDLESVMHYHFNSALTPKVEIPEGVKVGQRSHLSRLDRARLHKAYPCKLYK